MNTIQSVGPLVLLLALAVAACERAPTHDTPGQTTTTTSAEEAVKKAATDVKDEVKKEWKDLDVGVETKGVTPKADAKRDAGASLKSR